MATQTDLDRLQVAWLNLQKAVNKSIPNTTAKLYGLIKRIDPPDSGHGR